ncbi:ATP-binding cassette domain-containing protein [Mycoplasmopsis sturni]|uniref:ATP-binding cassette domain-containing protein n=1 Tax=Mycoplasmopsis sturni TaxID=39047 RepID=UPI000561BE7B|nr:ATP-binding cassette domain-containing protein [Mycoplasmopsis sturni]
MLLKVNNLSKVFTKNQKNQSGIFDVSFEVNKSEILGLIGESGSGKTTIGKILSLLYNNFEGEFILDGISYKQNNLDKEKIKQLRRNLQVVFQDPNSSLNQNETVFNILKEPILVHKKYTKEIEQILLEHENFSFELYNDKVSKFNQFVIQNFDQDFLNLSYKINSYQNYLDFYTQFNYKLGKIYLFLDEINTLKYATQKYNNISRYLKTTKLENIYKSATKKQPKLWRFKLKKAEKLEFLELKNKTIELIKKIEKKLVFIGISKYDFWLKNLKTIHSETNAIVLWKKKQALKEYIIEEKVFKILEDVGLEGDFAFRLVSDFSGGQKQRIAIARALIVEPKIIIADEPISSLDLSIQAQIINLINDLCTKKEISVIFIAHDLNMVKYLSTKLVIMYKGKVVERGNTKDIFDNPMHPYSRILINPKSTNKNFEQIDNLMKNSSNEYIQVSPNQYVLKSKEAN